MIPNKMIEELKQVLEIMEEVNKAKDAAPGADKDGDNVNIYEELRETKKTLEDARKVLEDCKQDIFTLLDTLFMVLNSSEVSCNMALNVTESLKKKLKVVKIAECNNDCSSCKDCH